MDQTKIERNALIDYLRFVMVMLIVPCHFYSWQGVKGFDFLYLVVEFFPIIAGYLFMDSLSREKQDIVLSAYAWKRFKRLFPYTFLALIPLLCYQAVRSTEPILKQLLYAFPEMFLISYNGMNGLWGTLNGPSWIILSMFLAELFLFSLCCVFKRKTITNLVLPVSVVWGYGYFAATGTPHQDTWLGLVNSGCFRAYIAICLGGLMYLLGEKIKSTVWTKTGVSLLSATELIAYGMCLALLLFCSSDVYQDSALRYVSTALVSIGIVLTFSKVTITGRIKSSGFSRYLGKLSLTVCLTHSFIIEMFYRFFEFPQKYTVLFLGVVILWAIVFQVLVDIFIKFLDEMGICLKCSMVQSRQDRDGAEN